MVENLTINLDAVSLADVLAFMGGTQKPKEMAAFISAVCGADVLAQCKGSEFLAVVKRIATAIGETENPKETA